MSVSPGPLERVCVCVKKETCSPISTLPVVLSALGTEQVPGPSQ